MNIILGSHYFFPHRGGIESVIESHAKRLAERGHNVTVISSDIGADSMRTERDGYKVRRFKAWNLTETLGVPYPIPNPINARKVLKDVFKTANIDIVHVHGLNYLTTAQILQYVPADSPVVMHQHTPFVEYPFPIQQVERMNDQIVGRWNLRQADLVFCINPAIERYVQMLEPNLKAELLMNGIDTEFFAPSRAKQDNPFNCDPDVPVFFTLSRMSQKKGIDTLLEAIKTIDLNDIDLHFAVAGDGPMREEVEKTAKKFECMETMGNLSDSELANCYAVADVFLFTSKSGEAFPTLTMIEALSSGTPVIASKLVENPIGIKEGENSTLFEPDNAKELGEAITELAKNSQHLSKMGKNARETAVNQFSIEDRIDRLESCYESLTSSSY